MTLFIVMGCFLGAKPLPPNQARPNILCLVIEDTSPHQFGCYGNTDIKTPTIDAMADMGIKYTNARSNAPHCSPARSTLITGCYATTFGMDIHRQDYITPDSIFYPQALRKAGYFCTNNDKTDYNTLVNNNAMWDESGKNASYNSLKRKSDQPFFAVFNTTATHMGLVRTITTEGRPDFKNYGIDINTIFLPPHVPDLPEVRSDEAYQLKASQETDAWVKAHLEDLKSKGFDENTIVFFFSDHGGCLPRGKGYPFESGLRVPLVVYVPPKWQEAFQLEKGIVETKNVSFVDFAPTFLSIAGIKPPEYMQGKAFLGSYEETPNPIEFGFRTNQENYHYDPCRTASDGHFKYIRNYIPHKPFNLRNLYQWGMPANIAIDEMVLSGSCKNEDWLRPYQPKESEMLFDLVNDPWELHNLANDPNYANKLQFFRSEVSSHIRTSNDLGFFPREMRLTKEHGLYQWVKDTNFPLEDLYSVAELVGHASIEDIPQFLKLLKSPYPEIRYWATMGLCELGGQKKLTYLPTELKEAMNDEVLEVASMAAEAACFAGAFDLGVNKLINLFEQNFAPAYSSLETLTWYPDQKKMLGKYLSVFQKLNLKYSREDEDRMGLGIKVRSILVNLGALSINELYLNEEKEEGIIKNRDGRKFLYPKKINARIR
ncbi:sulfatase family protein [Aestuariivivens insulae]|uniref:sulfatase family protein n=1 Tax=Aestuariivivens insulae TaxID=1621988 RepID=UPI001F56C2D5|nr:sulfatase [Aestuariivivens insulae]